MGHRTVKGGGPAYCRKSVWTPSYPKEEELSGVF